MSHSPFAVLITLGILVLLALWVPCLHVCHRCVRKITRRNLPAIALAAGCLLALHGSAFSQLKAVGHITTVAGTGRAGFSGDGGLATSALLNTPAGVVLDGSGNLYIADQQNSVVRLLNHNTGKIATVVGNGTQGFAGDDGPATKAELNTPEGLALDAQGNLYIADLGNGRIRMVSKASGAIITVAGNGAGTYSGDGGAATNAGFNPQDVAIDAAGNLYISDNFNNRIRMVKAGTEVISTIAGTGRQGSSGDGGPATSATMWGPRGLRIDTFGNLYFADQHNATVRKVKLSTGVITTVAGGAVSSGGTADDGSLATNVQLSSPNGVEIDSVGDLFIADLGSGLIRRVDAATGIITTVAGSGNSTASGVAATQASLTAPAYLALDSSGNVFVSEQINGNLVREVSPLTFPATAVGSTSTPQTLFLQATTAETIQSPLVIPVSQGGKQEYSVASTSGCSFNSPITAGSICSVSLNFTPAYPGQRGVPLQVTTTAGSINLPLAGVGTAPLAALSPGLISTIAGGCTTGCSAQDADGVLASNEPLSAVYDVKVNSAGEIYFSDELGVRKISATTGIVTTVSNAGTNFALDNLGNLYIQSFSNYGGDTSVSKVNGATGDTTVIAGKQGLNNGTTGTYGNIPTAGVPATQSYLPQAKDVEVDSAGNIYLSTSTQILRIDAATDILTYVTGSPNAKGYSGDGGLATAALVSSPLGMVFDQAGNLYFSDSGNYVVRRIDAVTGNITTFAGNPNGTENETYVGPATGTNISPQGLAIDSAGNLYINDQIDRFLGIRRVDAATNIMTTIAGYAPSSITGYTARATDAALISGFALDSLGNMITFSQGVSGGTISKIDVSTSLINFPFTLRTVQGPVPPVGTAYPNASADMVNVTNIGNSPLSISSPPAGTNPSVIGSAYKLDDPATAGCVPVAALTTTGFLAAGTSCFLAVDFTPTAATNPASIGLYDNSLNTFQALQTVTLAGQGVAATTSPTISLSPGSLSFPDTQVGTISNPQTVTVSNTGTATADITGLTIVGADSTSFAQTSNCGMTLANGSTCTINVTFAPTAANRSFTANVTVASNDLNSPATATLTGKGLDVPAGVITLSPSAVTFSTTVGVTAFPQTVTLTNTGAAQVTLGMNPVTVAGANAPAFAGSAGFCGYTLAVGASCNANVTLVFNATPGTYTASFNATYYATSTTTATSSIPLTGTVTAAVAQAALTPTSYNFGNVTTGTSAPSQTFTISNAGAAALSITSVTLNGTNAVSFSIRSNGCVSSLAAGSSCTISVNFAPSETGTQTATLSVVDAAGTQTSSLSGTGVAPPIPADFKVTATPATQSTYRGHSLAYFIQVASLATANPFSNAVTLSVTGLPSGTTATLTPTSVVPGTTGSTSTLTVTVPGLTAANIPASQPDERQNGPARGLGISMACLAAAALLRQRKKPMPRLLATLLLFGMGAMVAFTTGCGAGAGFAIPTSTSTLTITGASGATTHSTTVTLTIQ